MFLQLYDEASRGPNGALKLLLKSGRGALLASLASFLTIATLLMDPFTQLVLTFESKATPAAGQAASIRVAEAYDTGSKYSLDIFGGESAVRTLLTHSTARYQMLISTSQPSVLRFSCKVLLSPLALDLHQHSRWTVLLPTAHSQP